MRDCQPDLPVPGDLIWIRRQQWRVRSTHAGEGLARVLVESGSPATARTFLLPCDRWSHDITRHSRAVSPQRALAWLAACAARVHPAFTPAAIVTSRASLLPYQLEPALAVLAGRRRILIADAVGLGKTIQAALIIAEMLNRRADARVLVLAPASLLVQWSDELRTRFSVAAQTADTFNFTRLRWDRPYLSSPWQGPGVWLASPDYLKQPHVIDAMPQAPFDLVVIDEAHATAGHSQRHAAVHSIARSAHRVVVLTATPHDGDETRFGRLVALGASGSPSDSLLIFRRARTRPPRRIRRLDVRPSAGLSTVLAAIDSFERAGRSGPSADGLHLICAVFRKRALSSIAALLSSIERRLAIVHDSLGPHRADTWAQPALHFGDERGHGPEGDDVMSVEEWSALRAFTGLPLARERAWLQRLMASATRASSQTARDPKLERIALLLSRSSEPVVIFTEYRDSLRALEGALTGIRRVAVLHGGLAGTEQRRALGAFLSGTADALLATDVASQGLNLQHRARWVVHFDMPWNPMRLEQRVGRVDRIGQARPVHVTAIGVRHQADAALRRRVDAKQHASEAAPLPNCTRWARAAEGLARLFARQRALAARWRGPDPWAVPRARGTASALRHLGLETQAELRETQAGLRESQAELRTIVEIPFITESGEVIERRLGWLASGDEAPAGSPAGAERLARRARVLGARARRRETRLQAALVIDAPTTPQQPGLFDKRDLDGSHTGGPDTEPVASTTTAPDIGVRIGQPRPLVILERGR